VAAAVALAVIPLGGQARGAAPAPPPPPAGRGTGAAAPAQARPAARQARIAGHPNFNGIWQATGTAHWNLEDHSASATPIWQLGALYAVPAGQSVIEGGTIPYLPAALKQRDENMKGWPKSDPEAKCYMPGIPRATYMPYPFQIVQGQRDILFVYEYASSNRIVHMSNHTEAPVDSWMGWSNGKWRHAGHRGERLQRPTWFDRAGNHHRGPQGGLSASSAARTINHQATEDPKTFSRPDHPAPLPPARPNAAPIRAWNFPKSRSTGI
jgi:hypothetical protein